MSYHELVSALKRNAPAVALRHALVYDVAADGSVTLSIGGDATTIAGVKVASSCCPIVGKACLVAIVDNDLFVLDSLATAVAHCHLRRAATQAIGTAAWTNVSYDTEDADPYGMHAAGAPTRITIKTPGIYVVHATAEWALNATGSRLLSILHNGAGKAVLKVPATGTAYQTASQQLRLAQGEHLELAVYQDSGGDLNLAASRLRASWISPL